jgi:hypothetical protein
MRWLPTHVSLFPRTIVKSNYCGMCGLKNRQCRQFAILAALLLAAPALLMAADAAPKTKSSPVQNTHRKAGKSTSAYLRIVYDKEDIPEAMQTAIVRCAAPSEKDGPTVDLIAAIHIADAGYYKQLNREFQNYDAVLYELVSPENARAPRQNDPPSHHPISVMQNGAKDMLGLEFQLKGIDYTVKNMVHADMSPDRLNESMEKRGESLWGMCVRMMGYTMAQQGVNGNGVDGRQTVNLLFSKDRTLALKRLVAEEFALNDSTTAALEGPEGSTLISGRNRVALDVLAKELATGKKKIAIFYGAAHMADIQKRLHEQFKMSPISTRWLTAWDMADKAKKKKDAK